MPKELTVRNKQETALQTKDHGYIRGIGSYFGQLFDSGQHDRVPFYPLWFNQYLNRKLPVLIDMNNLMLVYSSVPALRTIFDKKSELFKNGKIRLFKKSNKPQVKDEEIFDHPFLKLMARPNCLPGGIRALMEQWCLMKNLYGTALIRKIKIGSYPIDLKCLPMGEMMIKPTGWLFDQVKLDQIIEVYRWMNAQAPQGGIVDFSVDEIIIYVDGQTDRYTFGVPKIITNKLAVSNLQLGMQTSNVIMADRGAQGILSNQATDASGVIPIDADERKMIEKAYREEYGLDEQQSKIIITGANVKWQPMTFPRRDLMLDEVGEQAFCVLCDMLGLQRELFAETVASKAKESIGGDGKGKLEEALKITYETTIREEAACFCEGFNTDPDFGLLANGLYCTITYDHLPVMQEDQVDAENVNNVKVQAAAAQTASILTLINAVKSSQMERQQAIDILVNVHQMDEAIADKLILEPKEITPPEPPEPETDEEKEFKRQLKTFKL